MTSHVERSEQTFTVSLPRQVSLATRPNIYITWILYLYGFI